MSRRPTLQQIISAALEADRQGLRTWAPAKVVKWDADKQRANCQILVKQVYYDEKGERKTKSWPIVTGVPVEFPGAGGYRITFPISDGNTVIDGSRAAATTGTLFFSHLSLDKWLSGNGDQVDPEFDHAHALTDAVFYPGLKPFGAPLGNCPTDHATIGADSGVQIHFHSTTIVAGDETGAQFVALANLVNTEFDKLSSTLGSGSTPVGGGTVTFSIPYVRADVDATQLKAK